MSVIPQKKKLYWSCQPEFLHVFFILARVTILFSIPRMEANVELLCEVRHYFRQKKIILITIWVTVLVTSKCVFSMERKDHGIRFPVQRAFFSKVYHASFLLCVEKDLPSLYVRRCITPKEMEFDEKELA